MRFGPECRCKCMTAIVETWSGDRTFTASDLDLSAKLPDIVERQKKTALLWRIRFNETEEFFRYLSSIKTAESQEFLGADLHFDGPPWKKPISTRNLLDPNFTRYVGPIRDSVMVGLETAGEFKGRFDLPTIGPASTFGAVEVPNVDLPWVLEVGCFSCCSNCTCRKQTGTVRWPDHTRWDWDPFDLYTLGGHRWILKDHLDPNTHTVTSQLVETENTPPTHAERESIYFAGNSATPLKPPSCSPRTVLCLSELVPQFEGMAYAGQRLLETYEWTAYRAGVGTPGWRRQKHPAWDLLSAAMQHDGWGVEQSAEWIEPFSVLDLSGVRNMVLARGDVTAVNEYSSTITKDLPDAAAWLDSHADNLLILDTPVLHQGATADTGHRNPDSYREMLASANNTLGELGSGITFGEIGTEKAPAVGDHNYWDLPEETLRFVPVPGNSLGLAVTMGPYDAENFNTGVMTTIGLPVAGGVFELLPSSNTEVFLNVEWLDDAGAVVAEYPIGGIETRSNGARLLVVGVSARNGYFGPGSTYGTHMGLSALRNGPQGLTQILSSVLTAAL